MLRVRGKRRTSRNSNLYQLSVAGLPIPCWPFGAIPPRWRCASHTLQYRLVHVPEYPVGLGHIYDRSSNILPEMATITSS